MYSSFLRQNFVNREVKNVARSYFVPAEASHMIMDADISGPAQKLTVTVKYHEEARTIQLGAIIDGRAVWGEHIPLNDFISQLGLPLPPYESWQDTRKS